MPPGGLPSLLTFCAVGGGGLVFLERSALLPYPKRIFQGLVSVLMAVAVADYIGWLH